MPYTLSTEEINEFREIFSLVDKDGSGTISKEELAELLETLGIETSPSEIDLMIAEIDSDQNGEIDFEEFVTVMSRKVNTSYSADQVKNAFKVFQGNCSTGYIRADTLIRALTTYGSEKISEQQARELVNQLEPNSEGLIFYLDYVNTMMRS